jgi:hypothetical protein
MIIRDGLMMLEDGLMMLELDRCCWRFAKHCDCASVLELFALDN